MSLKPLKRGHYDPSPCDGKIAYATKARALDVIRRKRRRHQTAALEPYRCTICGGYHIGGKTPFRETVR